ncbi:hypothetical protein BT69DRAFT_1284139 [Atractiella rhizophila]|nr:hypothetical protein BT69DRAFT_1284139 [Atractiella rhizophila]
MTNSRINQPAPLSNEPQDVNSRPPRIWPNPEGIFVRVEALEGPSWVCLRWEKLEEYLLDPRNTEGLPEDDVLKRTAKHLQAPRIGAAEV